MAKWFMWHDNRGNEKKKIKLKMNSPQVDERRRHLMYLFKVAHIFSPASHIDVITIANYVQEKPEKNKFKNNSLKMMIDSQ